MRHFYIRENPISKFLFGSTKMAWFWLIVRVYVGWQWLEAGWGKLHSPAWVGDSAGAALTGFVKGALAKTAGEHPDVQGWYAAFLESVVLPNASTWSHTVAWGEVLVGVALVIGALTGIAAFFGLFMNLNFLLAGTVSVNPTLFFLSIGLVLAWKVAGFFGVDYYLLWLLGVPWRPGRAFDARREEGAI
jgi:thiosulfate dehydrogenase (quinone) large subunit